MSRTNAVGVEYVLALSLAFVFRGADAVSMENQSTAGPLVLTRMVSNALGFLMTAW